MPRKRNTNTSLSINAYSAFLKGLQLIGFGLDSSSSKLDRLAYSRLHRQKSHGIKKITANYDLSEFTPDYFEVSAHFKLVYEDPESKDEPLSMECVFGSHFHGKKPLNEEFAKRFARAEFRFVAWPYFRQFVSDMTGRMLIAPITIPLSADD